MRGRQEAGLEGTGRQVHARIQHGVVEAPEAADVAAHDLRKAADTQLVSEEQAEHAACLVGRERDACRRGCSPETIEKTPGLRLEAFDGVGAYRATEKGRPVDASGDIVGVAKKATFQDAKGLAKSLLESEEVQKCMAQQWTQFALGRDATVKDGKSLDFIQATFRARDLDLKALVMAVAKSRSFRYHSAQ